MDDVRDKNLLIGCLCALGCETLFGFSYLATKQAIESASILALLGWRFFIAVLVMSLCILLGIIKVNFRGKNIKNVLAVALFSPVLYFISETIGIRYTTSSESGVFLACIPVASVIASTLILQKKPSRMQVAGILVTLVGVLVTVLVLGMSASLSVIGYVCLLGAVVSYALYSVFVEKACEYTGGEITYVMLATGAIVFVSLALMNACISGTFHDLLTLPVRDTGFLTAILYQGMGCSILAFFLSNVAIAKIGVNRTSSFIGVSTVVSIIAGVVLLHEKFTVFQVVGAMIILIGVYIANAKEREKQE